MRSHFWLASVPCCAALSFAALSGSVAPAAAQEKSLPEKSPRFALSIGAYSGAQLFDYEDHGVSFRLDYTFYRLPRHEAVASLLYADVTTEYKPSFAIGGGFGSGSISGSTRRRSMWLGSAEYRWRFGSGNRAYIGVGLGVGDTVVSTLPLGYDFGSLFVEARTYIGADDNFASLSSTVGLGIRF